MYVELPEAGSEVEKGSNFGVVESVKVQLILLHISCPESPAQLVLLDFYAYVIFNIRSCADAGSVLRGHICLWTRLFQSPIMVMFSCSLQVQDDRCLCCLQAASDVYSPITGEVVESNQALADDPGKVCTFRPSSQGYLLVHRLQAGALDPVIALRCCFSTLITSQAGHGLLGAGAQLACSLRNLVLCGSIAATCF